MPHLGHCFLVPIVTDKPHYHSRCYILTNETGARLSMCWHYGYQAKTVYNCQAAKTAPQHLAPILIKKMAINFNSMASHRSSRINSDTHLSCSSCADCFIFITNFSSSAILLALLFNTAFNFGCSFCNVVSCFTTYSTNGLGIKNLTNTKNISATSAT